MHVYVNNFCVCLDVLPFLAGNFDFFVVGQPALRSDHQVCFGVVRQEIWQFVPKIRFEIKNLYIVFLTPSRC